MTKALSTIAGAIGAALALLPPRLDSLQARIIVTAITLQEDPRQERVQRLNGGGRGAARGLWQFEQGGVNGVLGHAATKAMAGAVCLARQVQPVVPAVWAAMETDDVLAAAFARLLVFTDSKPLPQIGDEEGAWQLYLRTWRPGAAKRQYDELRAKWAGNYTAAIAASQP